MSKTITDETYTWIIQKNATTLEEITEYLSHTTKRTKKYAYDKIITPLVKQNKIDRVRRGLYTAIDPVTDRPVADPIIVASKLRDSYYLGHYSALTLYGSVYSARTQAHVYVHPEDRFKEFTYNGVRYTPLYTEDTQTNIQTIQYRGHAVRVCGKERLLIEVIDSPKHIGGWEQSLKSMETLGGVEYEKIPALLERKGNQKLLRKTGFVLELLRDHSIYHRHLPEKVVNEIQRMVRGQPMYMEKNRNGSLNRKWMLYIHPSFNEYLRGI